MPSLIRLVVPTIILLMAGWIGHGIGAARLEDAQAKLRALETASQASLARQDAARQQLADALQNQEAEFTARLAAERRTFDEQKVEMAEAFDEVQERLVVLSGQRKSNDAELKRVRLELASASIGPLREELNRREARLLTLQGQIKRLQAGLNCMQAPVPADAVTRLNRVSASRSAAR
jgi:chromosome segregation ATPase